MYNVNQSPSYFKFYKETLLYIHVCIPLCNEIIIIYSHKYSSQGTCTCDLKSLFETNLEYAGQPTSDTLI